MYKRLKDLRNDKDITQCKLAESLGLYTTTYRRYESGENELPFDLAIHIAKFYNVSLDYIAGLIDKPEPLDRNRKIPGQKYFHDDELLIRAFAAAPDNVKAAIRALLQISPVRHGDISINKNSGNISIGQNSGDLSLKNKK